MYSWRVPPRKSILARLALAATVMLICGAATPLTRAEVEQRLLREPRGLNPSDAAAIAREAAKLLLQIADDHAAAPPLRGRAMDALAYARTAPVHDFLENFLIRTLPSRDATDLMLLRKAAVALGWQAGGRAVEILALVLDHPDREVRLDAAVALGLTRAQAAEKPLRARLAQETDAAVRAQIETQLKVLAPPAHPNSPGP